MKNLLQILLLISGFLPATYLSFLCILVLTSGDHMHITVYIVCILGLGGYIGMFLLFLEHRVNNWSIVVLLLAGIVSFILFVNQGRDGAWKWVLTIEEPDEWFIFVWPSVIALLNITRLLIKKLKPKRAVN